MTPATLAARDDAAVFLLDRRTHIEITGKDRSAFLHNFCTNDIKSLQPGQGCEAFLCNVKGRVLGHVTVFIGEQSIWLETVPDAAPKLMTHLDRYIISEDVQLHDRTHKVLQLHVIGPKAIDVLALGGAPSGLESMSAPGMLLHSGSLWVCAVNWFDQRSYLIFGDAGEIRPLHGVLAKADQVADSGLGTMRGIVAGSADDWESLRIDAGFPQYGVDITEDNLPQEVGRTKQCISFTKGCYLGQEPIARLDSMGHTNRELRRLIGSRKAETTELLDAASQQPVGNITSAAENPFGEGIVALGYLKSNSLKPGTTVLCGKEEFQVR